MSNFSRRGKSASRPSQPVGAPASASVLVRGDTYHVAMKPRRRLLVILSAILLVWIGVLLAMYFMVIYPQRHGAATGQPAGNVVR
ncbi:MAG: hypothetical protein IT448_03735 [Phycisphaerales bacterium]|nr:hypothetical protein [Phycisphaerales bacterium]